MKYCIYCGAQAQDDAAFCVRCGRGFATAGQTTQLAPQPAAQPVQPAPQPAVQPAAQPAQTQDETLSIIVKIFLILGCISQGWLLLPLLWCIPLTVAVFNSFRDKRPIGTGMKVCVLLFVNMIAGICLLCMDDNV